jgi:hypothetical protein
MIKKTSYMSSASDGSVVNTTVFVCGPIHECSKCPALVVISSDGVSGEGLCAFHNTRLSRDGDYPRNCRVTKITFEERL